MEKFDNPIKGPWHNITMMVAGLFYIIDGLCLIVSLGFYTSSSLSLRFLLWKAQKEYELKND